jgi:hypothetical protein
LSKPEPSCRLYCILARDGGSAAVFRRGPSRQVQLLKWDLRRDTLEPGQWFKGRIYERRCDLSPDGELLVYFAAKHKGPLGTWTAVSRPPYLTALALWPKGDAWGGGGHFFTKRHLGLNHPSQKMALGKDFQQPRSIRVEPVAPWAGRGEDSPINDIRMSRDGWRAPSSAHAVTTPPKSDVWMPLEKPVIAEKPFQPGDRKPLLLRSALTAIGRKGGRWYVEDFSIHEADGRLLHAIPDCCWADWDDNGDLLFAIDGRLFRLKRGGLERGEADLTGKAKLVADLTANAFSNVAAPRWALGRI